MGVYEITWTPAIILGWFGPWSQIFAHGPFGHELIFFFAIFSQTPTIWVSMDSPGPQQSVFKGLVPLGPNFGSKGLLEPNSKICTFVTKPHNMGVYGLAWTPAISFRGIRTPVAEFWVQGAFGTKLKNRCFWNVLLCALCIPKIWCSTVCFKGSG